MQDHKLFKTKSLALSLVLASSLLPHGLSGAVQADTISPNITSGGRVYSEEKPNKAFFGTGMSGRLSEASYLRFMGEQALDDGDLPAALQKLSKAVQLDAGDPTGHLLFARAMTMKINRALKKGEDVDSDLLDDCIAEWKLLARHDADTSEQAEAKVQCRRLTKIAKLLNAQMEGKVAVKKRGLFFGRLARNDGGSKTAREKIKLADKERPDKDEEKSEDL
ncbi:MAG: hypothetical protein IT343_08910 [Candidatus Melainabacteria bacterium]|jgi:hypothetical protein|nr:hypothetical protein [Candidatus Melainabacteria bacterium]